MPWLEDRAIKRGSGNRMQVLEKVTSENFYARGYLLANNDLRIAFGEDEAAAARHLFAYGLKENHHQLTKEFMASSEFPTYLRGLRKNLIAVFERATPEKFNAGRYLLANADLRMAFGEDDGAAERHFHQHGLKEVRRQVSAHFLSTRQEKFGKFELALPECGTDRFPITLPKSPHQLNDYDTGSANPSYGFWISELDANPSKLYADIGAGLRDIVLLNRVYVEVYPSITADIVIDSDCRLPFKDASLDGFGCFAILEHVSKPWEMSKEFARVVKAGGKVFID